MTPVEFRENLWQRKTRVPGLSCDGAGVILRLAVLVELRLVTDTDTDGHRPMASTADALHRAVTRSSAIAEGPRCVVSIEILPVATQQCRNYLYDKS